MQTVAEFQVVAIGQVRESHSNPRKHFDKAALAELTVSVKEKGILVPLLVRPMPGMQEGPGGTARLSTMAYFEIVAGARRYRAALAAGLQEIPVLVRELTDEQALEVQVIENLQREDVHPLEEAEGYKQLLAKGKYEIAALAAKVGKSESYIYQRLKLAELAPAAKKAFLEGTITAGHAILLARLQPKDQAEALEAHAEHGGGFSSVRELASWIHENVHLELKTAPWDLTDVNLVVKAGSCKECPKRSGANPQLFPDVEAKDVCTDPGCFDGKMQAHLARIRGQLEKSGKRVALIAMQDRKRKDGVLSMDQWRLAETNEECKGLAIGLVVEGGWHRKEHRRGAQVRICIDRKCKTHWSESERGGSSYNARTGMDRAKERKTRALDAARVEAMKQIAAKVRRWDLQAATARFASRTIFDSQKLACKILGVWPADGKLAGFDFREKLQTHIQAQNPAGVTKVLAVLTLLPEFGHWGDGYYDGGGEITRLRKAGKALHVNVEKLERQFVQAANDKAKKKGKKKPKAKKPDARRGTCRICGCTVTTPCMGKSGPCGWADDSKTLCSNPKCLAAAKKEKAA